MKFFKCELCGKITVMVKETAAPTVCCGKNMVELVPCSTDAATEKHVPVVTVNGKNVKVAVGSVTHPMEDAHYIEWICVETSKGYQIKNLKPGQTPEASFDLAADDDLVKVYAYCNLHGLWSN